MALIRKWISNSGVTLNGGDVSSWVDTEAADEVLQSTAALQPTLITDALGHKALRGEGTEYLLSASTSNLDFTTGTLFVIAVIKRATSIPIGIVCGKGTEGNNTQWQMYLGQAGNTGKVIAQWVQSTDNYRGRTTRAAISADSLQTVAASYTMGGTNNNVYANGALDNDTLLTAGSAPTTTTNAKKFGIFNFEDATFEGTFDLYELRIYDAIPADVPALHSELFNFYNAPPPVTSSGPGFFMGSPTWSKRHRRGRRR